MLFLGQIERKNDFECKKPIGLIMKPEGEEPDYLYDDTAEYMKKLKPKQMHACHCADLNSKITLSRVVNLKEVGAGLVLEYD